MPQQAIDIMTQWYEANYSNPYPTFQQCEYMANHGQITISQVKQWFVNVRRRTQNQFRKKRTAYKKINNSDESTGSNLSSLNNHFNDESNFELDFNPIQYNDHSSSNYNSNQSNYNMFNYQSPDQASVSSFGFFHSTPLYNTYYTSSYRSYSSPSYNSNVSSASSQQSFTNVTPNCLSNYYDQQLTNNFSSSSNISNF